MTSSLWRKYSAQRDSDCAADQGAPTQAILHRIVEEAQRRAAAQAMLVASSRSGNTADGFAAPQRWSLYVLHRLLGITVGSVHSVLDEDRQ
ncbi:MAG TPA: hypothetical protein VIH35_04710, partial [Kiritimatiellia bacterium]